ncbi:MAG: Crp/Fnr family transcriptional regulator [Myxococcales bacterium]|nr:Crp/Fnr family transcriptional regulator [Myxococcales bacterium]
MELDSVERTRLFDRYGSRFAAGTLMYPEGAAADFCYLLQEGRVRLSRKVRGVEHSIAVLRPGDIFGEDALISTSERSSSALALSEVSALAFDRETFCALLSSNPEVGLRLLEQLVDRLRDAEERLENILHSDDPSRVIHALLRLAKQEATSDHLVLDISPLELSSRVGLDVDAVKQVMAQLKERGYLRIQQERVMIQDIEALRRLYELLGVKEQVRG